jgi:dTMP kinase
MHDATNGAEPTHDARTVSGAPDRPDPGVGRSPRRGWFVVVEGGDGAGKSTQVELLAGVLDALVTFEPGDTPLGAQLREVLLRSELALDDRAEALLMAADRAQHVATVIRPALESGRNVICSRFTWSSLAYQGEGRGIGIDAVASVDEFARAGLEPDLTLLFDIDPSVALARAAANRGELDRIESAGDAFAARVRAAMLAFAAEDPAAELIDASGSIDEVHAAAVDALVAHGLLPDCRPVATTEQVCRFCGNYGWTADPLPSGEPDPATLAECGAPGCPAGAQPRPSDPMATPATASLLAF